MAHILIVLSSEIAYSIVLTHLDENQVFSFDMILHGLPMALNINASNTP